MQLTLLLATAALAAAAPVSNNLLGDLTSKLTALKTTLGAANSGDVGVGNVGQALGDIDATLSEMTAGNVATGDITGVGGIAVPVSVGDVASGNDISDVASGNDVLGDVNVSDFLQDVLGDVTVSDVVSELGLDASGLQGLDLGNVNTLSGFATALGVSVQDLVSALNDLGVDTSNLG